MPTFVHKSRISFFPQFCSSLPCVQRTCPVRLGRYRAFSTFAIASRAMSLCADALKVSGSSLRSVYIISLSNNLSINVSLFAYCLRLHSNGRLLVRPFLGLFVRTLVYSPLHFAGGFLSPVLALLATTVSCWALLLFAFAFCIVFRQGTLVVFSPSFCRRFFKPGCGTPCHYGLLLGVVFVCVCLLYCIQARNVSFFLPQKYFTLISWFFLRTPLCVIFFVFKRNDRETKSKKFKVTIWIRSNANVKTSFELI